MSVEYLALAATARTSHHVVQRSRPHSVHWSVDIPRPDNNYISLRCYIQANRLTKWFIKMSNFYNSPHPPPPLSMTYFMYAALRASSEHVLLIYDHKELKKIKDYWILKHHDKNFPALYHINYIMLCRSGYLISKLHLILYLISKLL